MWDFFLNKMETVVHALKSNKTAPETKKQKNKKLILAFTQS